MSSPEMTLEGAESVNKNTGEVAPEPKAKKKTTRKKANPALAETAASLFDGEEVPFLASEIPGSEVLYPGSTVIERGHRVSDHPITAAVVRRGLRWLEIEGKVLSLMTLDAHYYERPKKVEGPIGTPPRTVMVKILTKAGAELICNVFQLQPTVEYDYDALHILGKERYFPFVCTLRNELDQVISVGRGIGIIDGNRNANAAAKMGQKSARIDAVLNLGFSDLFLQEPNEGRHSNSVDEQVRPEARQKTPAQSQTKPQASQAKPTHAIKPRPELKAEVEIPGNPELDKNPEHAKNLAIITNYLKDNDIDQAACLNSLGVSKVSEIKPADASVLAEKIIDAQKKSKKGTSS